MIQALDSTEWVVSSPLDSVSPDEFVELQSAYGRRESSEGRDRPMIHERSVPEFFAHWREDWAPAGPWGPIQYLNQDESLRTVLMAQWLFCPQFVEYRGGVYVADGFSPKNVDDWMADPQHTVAVVEEVVNRVKLWDVFSNCDLDGLEDDLDELAVSLASCWHGALESRFPGRTFSVIAEDAESGVYGPGVTFVSSPTPAEPSE